MDVDAVKALSFILSATRARQQVKHEHHWHPENELLTSIYCCSCGCREELPNKITSPAKQALQHLATSPLERISPVLNMLIKIGSDVSNKPAWPQKWVEQGFPSVSKPRLLERIGDVSGAINLFQDFGFEEEELKGQPTFVLKNLDSHEKRSHIQELLELLNCEKLLIEQDNNRYTKPPERALQDILVSIAKGVNLSVLLFQPVGLLSNAVPLFLLLVEYFDWLKNFLSFVYSQNFHRQSESNRNEALRKYFTRRH